MNLPNLIEEAEQQMAGYLEGVELHSYLSELPLGKQEEIVRYIMQGRPVGHFLFALLSGAGFLEICRRSSDSDGKYLHAWAEMLEDAVPPQAHGSLTAVRDWIKQGGLLGQSHKDEG